MPVRAVPRGQRLIPEGGGEGRLSLGDKGERVGMRGTSVRVRSARQAHHLPLPVHVHGYESSE